MLDLREKFLTYFSQHQHTLMPSAPLITEGDSSLLFVNSGMAPLKRFFTAEASPPATRLTSCQRCLRAGGKHNDLEQVGYTNRHHTFFEMLGNFSFGAYFKEEAIRLAWTFITQELNLDRQRLYVTVYHEDLEAADLWRRIAHLPSQRIIPIATADNFWSMGDTGPCGPCSEIFFDQGEDIQGGLPGTENQEGDRYLEIWNLVFMQYNRTPEGLQPLAFPCIDTGMGLERLESVIEGVTSTYATQRFQELLQAISTETGASPLAPSCRIIADHARAVTFLASEGLRPSSEGRGYVMRRLMRRAYRHAHVIGASEGLLGRLIPQIIRGADLEAAEALKTLHPTLQEVFETEEKVFGSTLHQGLRRLEETVAECDNLKRYPGDKAFELYDTYGFPLDMTLDILKEKGLGLDQTGFDKAMASQKERSRTARHQRSTWEIPLTLPATVFTGYTQLDHEAEVLWISYDPVKNVTAVICDTTPFYAESGGQVGDTGWIHTPLGDWAVEDTQKEGPWILHIVPHQALELKVGQPVKLTLDSNRRQGLRQHHTATHLLHAALREVLGPHVNQKGSLVKPTLLRFDYSHSQPLTAEQRTAIETLINSWIWQNGLVTTEILSRQQAADAGATGLFEGKYGDEVRVVSAGGVSLELCGGTHVAALGQLGCFKLLKEGSLASGVRRVEAVVGQEAVGFYENKQALVQLCCTLLGVDEKNLATKVAALAKLPHTQKERAATEHPDIENIKLPNGLNCITGEASSLKIDKVRAWVDDLKAKYTPCCIAICHKEADTWSLFLACQGITFDVRSWADQLVVGRGGGRPDLAQWGGKGLLDKLAVFKKFKNLCQGLLVNS